MVLLENDKDGRQICPWIDDNLCLKVEYTSKDAITGRRYIDESVCNLCLQGRTCTHLELLARITIHNKIQGEQNASNP